MKENIINLFNENILKNRVMVKIWNERKQKWDFKIIDVRKEEADAVISYSELIKYRQIK